MAERRMFAKTIIDSDEFLEMPSSTQNLYFHLGMRADDDGVVNNAKAIMRMCGAKDDDMNVLISKKFVLSFPLERIIVIKHWKINNYIQKDRRVESKYKEILNRLILDENNAYKMPKNSNVSEMDTECIQNGYKVDTQYSIGKDSIDKYSINTICTEQSTDCLVPVFSLPLNTNENYPFYEHDIEEYKKIYPAVDVEQEFRNMIGWLNANPKNRKTKQGIKRFVNAWLSRCQDRKGITTNTKQLTKEEKEKTARECGFEVL